MIKISGERECNISCATLETSLLILYSLSWGDSISREFLNKFNSTFNSPDAPCTKLEFRASAYSPVRTGINNSQEREMVLWREIGISLRFPTFFHFPPDLARQIPDHQVGGPMPLPKHDGVSHSLSVSLFFVRKKTKRKKKKTRHVSMSKTSRTLLKFAITCHHLTQLMKFAQYKIDMSIEQHEYEIRGLQAALIYILRTII